VGKIRFFENTVTANGRSNRLPLMHAGEFWAILMLRLTVLLIPGAAPTKE